MPFYNYLRRDFPNTDKRNTVTENLIRLKSQLNKEIPPKDLEDNLLLATWNIRDFGKKSRRGFGNRTRDSLYYIAEILSSFDLIAVQEVNELKELSDVMWYLGPSWDYIATDVADRAAGGNDERMTFIYDKRKVLFQNIAGEIVLPPNKLISKTTFETEDGKKIAGKQFRRTPFIVSFQSGWFKFDLCTVHIYYGKDSGAGMMERIGEIKGISKYLYNRGIKRLNEYNRSLILLGDFNIRSPDHKTMDALLKSGFKVPEKLQQPTNVKNTMYYDQMAFIADEEVMNHIEKDTSNQLYDNAGVFRVINSVFRPRDFEFYKTELLKSSNAKDKNTEVEQKKYYKEWRTYQMSDHNLLWVRLKINNSLEYLNNLIVI